MLWWTIQNSLVIAALALAIVAMSRVVRLRPSIEHALWLVLFIKFLTPPVVEWPWSLGHLIAERKRETAAVSDAQRSVGEIPPVRGDLSTDPPTNEVAELISSLLIDPQSPLEVIPANDSSRTADLPHFPKPDAALSTSGATWPWIVFAVWLMGAAGVALTRIWRIQRVRRVVREARPAPAWLVDELIGGLSKSIGVRAPNALCTPAVNSPCLWCFGQPVLLWPEHLADANFRNAWRGVIVHELAHLRRRDHWVTWLELFAGCVWWFNPVFWFVRRRLYASAELACDAWAVAAAPGGVRAYAESLVEVTQRVAQTARSASLPSPALGASSGTRRTLERRLTMILSQPRPCRISRQGLLGTCVLALLALPAWSLDAPAVDDPAAPRRAIAVDAAPSLPSAPAKAAHPAATAPIDPPTFTPTADGDRINKLERQIDALLKEVRELREARTRPGRTPSTVGSDLRALAPDGKVLAVISGAGQVTLLDAATGKELFRTKVGSDSAIRSLAFSPDGKTLTVQDDGKVSVLDAMTGKIVRVTSDGAAPWPSADKRDPEVTVGRRSGPSRRSSISATKVADTPSTRPAASSYSALGGVQLDLVRLATEYSDAAGNAKLADRLFDLTQKAHSTGEATQKDVITAEINLQNAHRKLKLLKTIAEAASQAAKSELTAAEKRHAAGQANESESAQARAKLDILMQILRSN